MNEYDIGKAFAAIEDELTASMIRNMKRHRIEEVAEQKEWAMWQAEQLRSLELYKRRNREKYGKQFEDINGQISRILIEASQHGSMEQEIEILEAIRNGFKDCYRVSSTMQAEFFALNERKLDALIKATTDDMKKAETAVLRMAADQYRKVIYNAQVYANTGAGTYEKAVDMATKDFLSAGLNCIEYGNGARHTIKDYADMAIRTASKRAYLQGEGKKRQEWGIHTVIMNKRGNPCPKCLPFVGKVLIDDVWSGGTTRDGPYPLMSTAIEAGLYHPRCKDSHTTYFPGISTADDTWTKEELAAVERNSKKEAKQQYANRQAERFGRLAKFSLDEDNRRKYENKANQWHNIVEKYRDSDIIKLTAEEQYALNQYLSFESYKINEKLRNGLALSTKEKKMVENLDSALRKMPRYEGNLSRSLYFGDKASVNEYLKKFEIGCDISFKEFLSNTCGNELYNPLGEVQIFIENSKMGRKLTLFNKKEMEILYERDSKFKVKNIVERDGKHWILLEETYGKR